MGLSAKLKALHRKFGPLWDGMMTRMSPHLSRRALLLGLGAATGAAGAYAVGATTRPTAPAAPPVAITGIDAPLAPPAPLEPVGPPAATFTSGSFVSAARGGVATNYAIARPPNQTGPLRPVILLHGKDATAQGVMALGVEQFLADATAAGLPPFAVAAADGGNAYWHHRASGEDPGAMVLDEFLPLLAEQGLDTSRVAFMGWSMGGYGAMLLGSRLGPARTAAICAVSPALWTSPGAAASGAFDGADDYTANSVWGLPALGSIPLRIDCGYDDPFYDATRQFIAQLPIPPAGGFSPGGHNPTYWSSQLTPEMTWLAPLLTA
jgi:S-formylglutathione hydrolase FrmB